VDAVGENAADLMAAYDITKLGYDGSGANGPALEFDTTNADSISTVKVPGKDWVGVFYSQSATVFNVKIIEVNTATGALTELGSVDVEPGSSSGNVEGTALVAIDGSNLMAIWSGPGSDGFAQLIRLSAVGVPSLNGSALEYDPTNGESSTAVLWDSTHVLLAYSGPGNDGFAVVLTFNVGDGTNGTIEVASGTSAHEFDTDFSLNISLVKLSSSKAVVFYTGTASDGFSIVLSIDGSYQVSDGGAKFEYLDASTIESNSALVINSVSSPMVVADVWTNDQSGTGQVQIRTFNINTSTWEIIGFGSALSLKASAASTRTQTQYQALLLDATHILIFYRGTDADGYAEVLSYNPSTGELASISELEFDTQDNRWNSAVEIQSGLYVNAWKGPDGDGFIQGFSVEAPSPSVDTANFFPFLDRR
jgi:hypothetical protein